MAENAVKLATPLALCLVTVEGLHVWRSSLLASLS